MKNNLFCFLLLIAFGGQALTAQEANNTSQTKELQSINITIEGMACQEGCADAISANLKKVAGVHSAVVSFATGKADIDFNPKEVSIDSLKSVITDTKVKDYIYTIEKVILTEDN